MMLLTQCNKRSLGRPGFKTEKAGIVHCAVGKCSFSAKQLYENILHVIQAVTKAKPSSSKGVFLKRVYISTTMGPGVVIDAQSLR